MVGHSGKYNRSLLFFFWFHELARILVGVLGRGKIKPTMRCPRALHWSHLQNICFRAWLPCDCHHGNISQDRGIAMHVYFIVFVCLFKRDNAHQLTYFILNMPELAKKQIFVCSPLAGQHIVSLSKFHLPKTPRWHYKPLTLDSCPQTNGWHHCRFTLGPNSHLFQKGPPESLQTKKNKGKNNLTWLESHGLERISRHRTM